MSRFTQDILSLDLEYKNAVSIKARVDKLIEKCTDLNNQYIVMLEAQQLLATVSDNNTEAVLDYITGIINKALSELFPNDVRRIYLQKNLYAGQHAHITVKLENSDGRERDLTLQSGTGLRQVISFLFVLSIIEIRKSRRILLMDELLSGLHPEAKRIVMDIVKIFAEEGFQFIIVEYGVNTGRLYIVEKPNSEATITPLDGNSYNNEIFIYNRPVEEIDKTVYTNEEE